MSNKKIFKNLYSKKINKDDNYKLILKRIENKHNKSIMWKRILVPICSLILVFGLISINVNQKSDSFKSSEQIQDTYRDYELYINNNTNTNNVTSYFSSDDIYDDANSKKVDVNYEELIQSTDYSFLLDLEIPNDLNNSQYKEVYVKENKNSGYNLLQNYEFSYQNNSDRNIVISVSDKYENTKNESSENNIKISKIKDIEVIIYQEESLYKVIFTYNNMNFNIITNNIDEEELINLLTSIIK